MQVNAVGVSGATRNPAQCEHKWWDLKGAAKKKVSEWRKATTATGGGTSNITPPTELHYLIISILGEEAVEGIPGTKSLDTSSG